MDPKSLHVHVGIVHFILEAFFSLFSIQSEMLGLDVFTDLLVRKIFDLNDKVLLSFYET